jgi:hypothetical protein
MNEPTSPSDSTSGSGWGRLDDEESRKPGGPAEASFASMNYGALSRAITIAAGVLFGVFLVIWGIIWLNGNSPYGYYPLIVGALALITVVYLVVRRMVRRRRAG